MNWIIFSIIPPFLWAVTNYVDKFLIEKYFKKSAGAALMLLIVSFSFLFVPFIYYFQHGAVGLSTANLLLLLLSSSLSVGSWILYARALSADDVSVVVPLFQLMPVYNYFLGLIFLGERISTSQIAASLLIILGSIIISLNFVEKRIQIKTKTILLMLLVTLVSSVNVLIVKYAMLQSNFWAVNFWTYLFVGIIGVTCILLVKPWREEIGAALKRNFSESAGISFLNEVLDFSATMVYRFAMLSAPIALVSVLSNGFQPVFILILGFFLALFLPHLTHEKFSKAVVVQRTIAIIIIFIGTFLISK